MTRGGRSTRSGAPMGSEGVRAAATGDTAVNGFAGKKTMGASTPTHRTHVCVAWCGPDSGETEVSLMSVQPSGQQILSTLTSTVNATRMRTATARTSREYIPATVSRTEPPHRNAKLNEIPISDSGTLGGLTQFLVGERDYVSINRWRCGRCRIGYA